VSADADAGQGEVSASPAHLAGLAGDVDSERKPALTLDAHVAAGKLAEAADLRPTKSGTSPPARSRHDRAGDRGGGVCRAGAGSTLTLALRYFALDGCSPVCTHGGVLHTICTRSVSLMDPSEMPWYGTRGQGPPGHRWHGRAVPCRRVSSAGKSREHYSQWRSTRPARPRGRVASPA